MKLITVVTKAKAMAMAKNHPDKTIRTYCTGRYIWHGTQKAYVGREQEVPDHVDALWVERRQDSEGAYAIFKCLV